MNTNNGLNWRRFIVPKKVEQINDYLFIDTYKSNNLKIGVNDMTVNDSEMCVRWKGEDVIMYLTGWYKWLVGCWTARL